MLTLDRSTVATTNPVTVHLNVFKKKGMVLSRIVAMKIAQAQAEEVKSVIDTQLYRWKPLSPKYLQFKERNRLDLRKLIAGGDYVRSISARWTTKDRIVVGPLRRRHQNPLTGRYDGPMLPKIARWMEFGVPSRNIPARQSWRPVAAKIKREMAKTFRRFQKDVLKPIRDDVRKGVKYKRKNS